jgi:hypothetical protein
MLVNVLRTTGAARDVSREMNLLEGSSSSSIQPQVPPAYESRLWHRGAQSKHVLPADRVPPHQ